MIRSGVSKIFLLHQAHQSRIYYQDLALHQKSGFGTRDGGSALNKVPLLAVARNFCARPSGSWALHQKQGAVTTGGSSVLNKAPLLVVACNFCARPVQPFFYTARPSQDN
jgi:hypothetical protein